MDFGAKHVLLTEEPGIDPKASKSFKVPQSIYANPSDEELQAFLKGRCVDTNVVAVRLGHLLETPVFKGAEGPHTCSGCRACMSDISEVQGKHWLCEFCGEMNAGIKSSLGKKLTAKAQPLGQEYVLKTPLSAKKGGNVIFCMDTSGSMGVTTEVPVEFKISADGKSWMCSRCALKNPVGITTCNACGLQARRAVHHVSRLELMQKAVMNRLDTMAKETPKSTAGLIAFNDEVRIIGDGTRETVVLPETSLYEEDSLRLVAMTQCRGLLETPVRDSLDRLKSKLNDLSVGGQTALGPALLLAITMAGQDGSGGRVVVCTDGLSNVGLGAQSLHFSPAERAYVREYFTRLAQYAIDTSVCVSIISIAGEECNLQEIGRLAEATGGNVIRVDATRLTESVSYATAEEIVATRVRVRFLTHTRLQPYWLGYPIATDQLFGLAGHEQLLGAVTSSSEAFFAFGSATRGQSRRLKNKPPTLTDTIPFQLQINYIKPDGTECLRVFSCQQPFATLRSAVEATVSPPVISSFASHTAAVLALDASYDDARALGLAFRKILDRSSSASAEREEYAHAMEDLYGHLPSPTAEPNSAVSDNVASALFNIKKVASRRFGWKGKGKTTQVPSKEEEEGYFNPLFRPIYDQASPSVDLTSPVYDRAAPSSATAAVYDALPPVRSVDHEVLYDEAKGFSNPLFRAQEEEIQYVVPPVYDKASEVLYDAPARSPSLTSVTYANPSALGASSSSSSRLQQNGAYQSSVKAQPRTYDVASPGKAASKEDPRYGSRSDVYDVLAHSPRKNPSSK